MTKLKEGKIMNILHVLLSIINDDYNKKDNKEKISLYNSQTSEYHSNSTALKVSRLKKIKILILVALILAGSITIIYGIELINDTIWIPAVFMSLNGTRIIPAGGFITLSTYPLSLENYLTPRPHIYRVIAHWNITFDSTLQEPSTGPIFGVIGFKNGTKFATYGLPNRINWTSIVINHNSTLLITTSNNTIGNVNGYIIGFAKLTFSVPLKDAGLGFVWVNPNQSPIIFNSGELTLEAEYHPYTQTGLNFIIFGIIFNVLTIIVYILIQLNLK